MYQNADKHLGYYESEQPAFFYGECETALSINVFFKTEENALRFNSHLQNESITINSPMKSLTINSFVSTTSTAPLGERIYYKDYIDLLILKENEKQRIASKTIAEPDNIITKAFPPLGRRQLYSSAKSTTRLESVYGIKAEVHSGTFAILKEFKQDHLTRATSLLWTEAETGTLADWSGEIDIQTYIKNALMDCLKISPLLQKLSIYRERTFSVARIMDNKKGNKVDLTFFVNDTSSITGVAEVKVPGSKMDDIYQIVDYMVDLRNSFNVRFVFGVYTTYEKWKILWFEDSQEAANSDSTEQYDELCLAGSANEYTINKGTLKIFQSFINFLIQN
jgi:3D (Asp-Asp-Asp) domain-containing protein